MRGLCIFLLAGAVVLGAGRVDCRAIVGDFVDCDGSVEPGGSSSFGDGSGSGGRYFVDANAPGPVHDGLSWGSAFKYLQDALSQARDGDEIMVAEGMYRPDADGANPGGTNDRTCVFDIPSGAALYGGFPSGGVVWAGRDANVWETILTGEIGAPGDVSDNSHHVVRCDEAGPVTIIDGFTVSGGYASGVSYPDNCGGGMINIRSSASIRNCRFRDNSAIAGGGAIYCEDSNCSFFGCRISDNQAEAGGGFCSDLAGVPILSNCTFSGNSAYGRPDLVNCVLFENNAALGGAICSVSPRLSNCTLYGNYVWESNYGGVGGMYAEGAVLTNCILWGNREGDQVDETAQILDAYATVNYCCIEGWTGGLGGNGNFGVNPLFSNAPEMTDCFRAASRRASIRVIRTAIIPGRLMRQDSLVWSMAIAMRLCVWISGLMSSTLLIWAIWTKIAMST